MVRNPCEAIVIDAECGARDLIADNARDAMEKQLELIFPFTSASASNFRRDPRAETMHASASLTLLDRRC